MKNLTKQAENKAELKQATKLVMETIPYAAEDVCAAAARAVIRYVKRKYEREAAK